MSGDGFSTKQQDHLKGLMAGVALRHGPLAGGGAAADPMDLQRAAQDRTLAADGALVPEEDAKRRKHPLGRSGDIAALAEQWITVLMQQGRCLRDVY